MTLDPRTTAVLVMDYQPGIIALIDDAEPLLVNAKRAIDAARVRGATVGYVRVGFTDEDYAAMPETSSMAAAVPHERREIMHADADTTAIDDRVAPHEGDIVVRKTRVGPFSSTDLDAQLRERGVHTLLLAGISTSGVVLSTVRAAADEDYRLVVLSDACADPNSEVRELLMRSVLPRQVLTTEQALTQFS